MRRIALAAGLVAVFGLGLVACTEEQQEELTEALVRNAAAVAGSVEFERAGHPLSGDLACSATRDGGMFDITCTGTTADDKAAGMTGSVSTDLNVNADLREGIRVEGAQFVGTVDGQEVFNRTCLGSDC